MTVLTQFCYLRATGAKLSDAERSNQPCTDASLWFWGDNRRGNTEEQSKASFLQRIVKCKYGHSWQMCNLSYFS